MEEEEEQRRERKKLREKEAGFLFFFFFFFEMISHGWLKEGSEKRATEKKNASFGGIGWLENALKEHELR